MNINKIHIAICFDERYFKYGLILIESILKFNQNNKIYFHLVLDKLDDSKVSIIYNLILESGNEFKRYFIPQNIEVYFDKSILANHPISYFHRYLLINLMDIEINKVLYLDTDILVNGDLLELWNINIENYELAAVLDAYIMNYEIDILKDIYGGNIGNYFNSGVMILKTDFWRNKENLINFIETVNNNNSYFADQNAANIIFKDKALFLHPKYNFFHAISEYPIKSFSNIYKMEQIKESFKNPVIIHFTYLKPDHVNCFHSKRHLFWKHLKHSKFKHYFEELSWKERLQNYIFGFGDSKNRAWIVQLDRSSLYIFYKLYKSAFLNSEFIQYLVKVKSKLLRKGQLNEE